MDTELMRSFNLYDLVKSPVNPVVLPFNYHLNKYGTLLYLTPSLKLQNVRVERSLCPTP